MERISIVFLIFLLGILYGGGCVLQRDKYWKRVWEELGKPDVKSIKELKNSERRERDLKILEGICFEKHIALFYFLKYVIIKLAKYF